MISTAVIKSNWSSGSDFSSVAKNFHRLLKPHALAIVYGNVEKNLGPISVHKGFRLIVCRSLDGKAVECEIISPRVESAAMGALGKRVSIGGIVKYSGREIPTSVVAERISVFRPDSELTPLSEITSIF